MDPATFGPDHFARFLPRDNGFMDDLEEDSVERNIPIIGPNIGQTLFVLVRATGAMRILELGTANGYSTIFMARALPVGGRIDTMEWGQEIAAEARENLEMAGVANVVTVHVGDALEMVKDLKSASFDLIFMDIEKEMYSDALEDCVKLLRKGGMLVCDNVAFKSSGDFNERIFAHPELETSFIYGRFLGHSPDEDALSMSVKV